MDGGGPGIVTSQPAPGQGTSNSNIPIALPAAGNPTNPFNLATEQTSLNTSEQATYTPGDLHSIHLFKYIQIISWWKFTLFPSTVKMRNREKKKCDAFGSTSSMISRVNCTRSANSVFVFQEKTPKTPTYFNLEKKINTFFSIFFIAVY